MPGTHQTRLESSGNFKPITYRESLPDDCPPDDAGEIAATRVVYRLVRNNPPTDDDFRSQRAERPDRVFRDVSECQARGVSVFDSLNAAERLSTRGRLPSHLESWCREHPDNRRAFPSYLVAAGQYDILANCHVMPR